MISLSDVPKLLKRAVFGSCPTESCRLLEFDLQNRSSGFLLQKV